MIIPLPVTESEKNACPMALIQTAGFVRASQRGRNINRYPLPEPGRKATRMASTRKIRKNNGIMILLLFSMLLAPNNSVRSVPIITII